MNGFKKILLGATVALLGLAVALPEAEATSMLRLTSSNGGSVTITDNGAGDSLGGLGIINFTDPGGILSGWNVTVTTGVSKPILGSSAVPHMDLNSVNVSGSTAGTLTIEFTDTFFTGPLPNGNVSGFQALIGGVTAGTVTYNSFLDPSNSAFAQTIALTTQGFSSGAFSGSQNTGAPTVAGNFSLTQVATITHAGGSFQVSSFDAELNSVPEPGSLLLLGSGLLALGAWRWRKFQA